MKYDDFFKTLASNQIAFCYLFEGVEEHVKSQALQMLRKKLLTNGFEEMNDSTIKNPTIDNLIANITTYPFMADKRILTVKDLEVLAGKANAKVEDEFINKLTHLLKNPPDTACLVFYVRGKSDKRRKLYKLIQKQAIVVEFEQLSDKELIKWITKEMATHGKTITQQACEKLYFTTGKDLTSLIREIDKLVAFALEQDEITSEMIENICTQSLEYKVFDMSNEWIDGNIKKANELLELLLRDGEDRVFLLSLLSRQCRQLLTVKRMILSNQANQIPAYFALPPFVVNKLKTQAGKYTLKQLEDIALLCIDTEFSIKSGALYQEGAFERIGLQLIHCLKENANAN